MLHNMPRMDAVFKALADSRRRELLDRLRQTEGLTLGQLCSGIGLTRQAVSRHLVQLEAAGLVVTVWRGREKLHHLNAVPIAEIYSRWIGQYEQHRVAALVDLKHALRETSMSAEWKPETFVYSIFIDSPQERVWQALTDGTFTRQYWAGRQIESDLTVGAPVVMKVDDEIEVTGEVLDFSPYSRLSYSWNSTAANVPRSLVVFELTQMGGSVQLQVTHSPLPADSMARTGWVGVLSSLKSYLEHGQPLAATALFRKARPTQGAATRSAD